MQHKYIAEKKWALGLTRLRSEVSPLYPPFARCVSALHALIRGEHDSNICFQLQIGHIILSNRHIEVLEYIMMNVDTEPTLVTVPGSRWIIPLDKTDLPGPTAHTYDNSMKHNPSTLSTTSSTSTSRRKPKVTYRSPDAINPPTFHINTHPPSSASNSNTKSTSHTKTNTNPSGPLITSGSSQSPLSPTSARNTFRIGSTCSFFTPAPPLFKLAPALPSYHPFSPGQLRLAAAARAESAARRRVAASQARSGNPAGDDASTQGESVATTDVVPAVPEVEETDGRRSSSRARRPAAKLREAEEDGLVASALAAAAAAAGVNSNGNGKEGGNGGKSPKRRRTGGSGSGNGNGGGSRKRAKKEPASEQYPRRERQRRGAAAAAAAAITESAEATAAALEEDAMEVDGVAPVAETPGSLAASGSPEDAAAPAVVQEQHIEEDAVAAAAPVPAPASTRPKRQATARSRRGRITSSASKSPVAGALPAGESEHKDEAKGKEIKKEEKPKPRTTRITRSRRGSSDTTSDAGSSRSGTGTTSSGVPIAETVGRQRARAARVTSPTQSQKGVSPLDESKNALDLDAIEHAKTKTDDATLDVKMETDLTPPAQASTVAPATSTDRGVHALESAPVPSNKRSRARS